MITRLLSCLAVSLTWAVAVPAKDLVGVYQDALQNDPQIRQANANRLATREARPQAWSALLPQVSALASRQQDAQSGVEGSLNFDPTTGTYFALPTPFGLNSTAKSWSVNLRESLFSWSNWMSLKAADKEVAEAEATYLAAQQNLILRVAQAYFNVLSAQDGLDANQASLEAIQRQLDQADKRFEVGLIAITDAQEAKAARDTAAAAVIAAKRTLATAGDQLSEITGQQYDRLSKPGEDMPLTPPQPASEDKWVDASMDQNPALLSSRLAADVARDNVRVAFGGHLPTLDLIASKSRTVTSADETVLGGNPFTIDSNVNDRQYTLQITVPIFSGGLTQSRVRQSQYQWIAAKEQVVQTSRATERQARDAYLGVISGIARVQALRQALKSSETALKATEAGYEVGTRTAVDVLNARRTLVQAQTDYAGSRYDYIVSVIQLRLAAGSLGRNDVQEINNWLAVTESTEPAQPIVPPESPAGAGGAPPAQSPPAPVPTPQTSIAAPATPIPRPTQSAAPEQPAPASQSERPSPEQPR